MKRREITNTYSAYGNFSPGIMRYISPNYSPANDFGVRITIGQQFSYSGSQCRIERNQYKR